MRPISSTTVPATPSRRGDQHFELGLREEVLDHGERHVHRALAPSGK